MRCGRNGFRHLHERLDALTKSFFVVFFLVEFARKSIVAYAVDDFGLV